MARNRVRLNGREIEARLKDDDVREAIREKADDMAAYIRGMNIRVGDRNGGPREYNLPVKVDHQTTDRAREVVVLDHPAGAAVEAKHSALTKAAAASGLEVRDRP